MRDRNWQLRIIDPQSRADGDVVTTADEINAKNNNCPFCVRARVSNVVELRLELRAGSGTKSDRRRRYRLRVGKSSALGQVSAPARRAMLSIAYPAVATRSRPFANQRALPDSIFAAWSGAPFVSALSLSLVCSSPHRSHTTLDRTRNSISANVAACAPPPPPPIDSSITIHILQSRHSEWFDN